MSNEDFARTCDSKQEYFLNRASCIAARSSMMHRHGCVIVRNGEIVAEGYNFTYTHLYHKYSIHAEICCLSKLPKNKRMLGDCEMYVVRIGTDNMGQPFKYSKPCPDCTKAINKAGIKKVFYTTNHDFYMKLEKIPFKKNV